MQAKTSLLILSVMAVAPWSGQVLAQEAGSQDLQEVVVTATRRAERAQDVPISLTAVSQEQMDAQGIRNIDANPALDNRRRDPGFLITLNEVSGVRSLA
jgi:outer membrane receptor protein involved in Fe transport